MTLAAMRQFFPIGEQLVRMEFPEGVKIARGELLRAEKQIPVRQEGNMVDFVVPSVVDFEVVALYTK